MESVLLKFGLCTVIVIDAGNKFKGTFVEMAECLDIHVHVAASHNHRTVGVERFHKFLNHTTKIYAEERGTPECFVECGMVSAYAWNASHINGTDIVRSIHAIGRELKFPLDINLMKLPAVVDNTSDSVAAYLHNIQNDVEFSRSILAWFAADRRIIHRERENEKRHFITFEVDDVVMVRSEVQSKKDKKIVATLVYQT